MLYICERSRLGPRLGCKTAVGCLLFTALVLGAAETAPKESPGDRSLLDWPAVTETMRPWTRWWWVGNAVDVPNLNRQLQAFHEAGFGGVEILPLYGARGYENRFIDFLSPKWMEMYAATVKEARRLGMGVHLTTTSGFPMGGPWVKTEDASSAGELRRYTVTGDGHRDRIFGLGHLNSVLPKVGVRCMIAVGPGGQQLDLTSRVKDGFLDWTAPKGRWKLYAIVQRQPVQFVKRASPGGEGYVVDPFSPGAMDRFLARFDEAFRGYRDIAPRAEFMDSYEQVTANLDNGGSISASWTNNFFDDFIRSRGYDLRRQMPAYFGEGDEETVARVRYDYRETINELHQAWVARWTQWSHEHGSVTREQAHCSPSNIEDTYAAADIPETEGAFQAGTDVQIPFVKIASSAAHVTGRQLASSETFTWLGDFYKETLAQLKPVVDRFYVSGINHVFFHGIPYSPADVPWPGWLFYAPVQLGLEGGLWHDMPAFTAYLTRCESVLQSGQPSNDLLLYFPIADFWQVPGEKPVLRRLYTPDEDRSDGLVPYEGRVEEASVLEFQHVGNGMLNGILGGGFIEGSPFYYTGVDLWERGYSWDQVTDNFVAQTHFENGALTIGGNRYQALVLPPCKVIPLETMEHLVALARAGATIVVQGKLPADVPGLHRLAERRAAYRQLLAELKFESGRSNGWRMASVGAGRFVVARDLGVTLGELALPREPMAAEGLQFIRRRESGGFAYFVINKSGRPIDQWVNLGTEAETVAILDPEFPDRSGMAALRSGTGLTRVYLQMDPDESLILRTSRQAGGEGRPWSYERRAEGAARKIAGPWTVRFLTGGPVLPADYSTDKLASWTTRGDAEARRFAGTAVYRTEFEIDPAQAADWRLDLGQVCESARVRLNGKEVATAWCPPFSLRVGKYLKPGRNLLEVEVTNLAANRIADLDRRHVDWKIFYDANVVNVNGGPFDASDWPLRDSGLIGPVALVPMKVVSPARN